MEKGDTVDYQGNAVRVAGDEQVQIDGRFNVVDQVDHAGAPHWQLQDVRADDMPDDVDPDLHRYLVPLDATPAAPGGGEQEQQLRDAFNAGVSFVQQQVPATRTLVDELPPHVADAGFADWLNASGATG